MGSATCSPPTDWALSDQGRCSSSKLLKGRGKSLRDLQTGFTLECCESQFRYPVSRLGVGEGVLRLGSRIVGLLPL